MSDRERDDALERERCSVGVLQRALDAARRECDRLRDALALAAPAATSRKHWPDCALNHGGAACDMGPDCGTEGYLDSDGTWRVVVPKYAPPSEPVVSADPRDQCIAELEGIVRAATAIHADTRCGAGEKCQFMQEARAALSHAAALRQAADEDSKP